MKSLRASIAIAMVCSVFVSLFQSQGAFAAACTTPTSTTWTGDGVTGTSGVVYTLRKFLAVETGCTWTIPAGVSAIDVLAVGGGGGAGFGNLGGGGGAGKLIVSKSSFAVSAGSSVTVTVGGGGAGGYNDNDSLWTNGQNGNLTSIAISSTTYTAIGGGAGNGGTGGGGFAGGSSGGASGAGNTPRTSPAVTASDATTATSFNTFGNSGGTAASNGAGGGGAGASGSGSTGGAGLSYWGMNLAGGGGGWVSGFGATSFGGGNAGAGYTTLANSGNPGTANTGGGGGGGNAGGSGILVIRYAPDTTAPTFTSSSFSAAENIATSATAATIRVSESATVTISSGADAARFNISRSETDTAIIKFNVSPDFEAPIDSGGNNVYDLTLAATDVAGNTGTQAITITVTNVVDTSAISLFQLAGGATVAAYRTAIVITVTVTVASKISINSNGKVIPGCKNRLASGSGSTFTATCTWKASTRGAVTLTATATPTGAGITGSTASPISIRVGNRTGAR
jgi:hypothetical protein